MLKDVAGFRQRKLIEYMLSIDDAYIINEIHRITIETKTPTVTKNDKAYFVINLHDLQNLCLFLNIKKSTLISKIKEIATKGIFEVKFSKKEEMFVNFNWESMIDIRSKELIEIEDLKSYNKKELLSELQTQIKNLDLIDMIGIKNYIERHKKN